MRRAFVGGLLGALPGLAVFGFMWFTGREEGAFIALPFLFLGPPIGAAVAARRTGTAGWAFGMSLVGFVAGWALGLGIDALAGDPLVPMTLTAAVVGAVIGGPVGVWLGGRRAGGDRGGERDAVGVDAGTRTGH